jgi:hypothetical protein
LYKTKGTVGTHHEINKCFEMTTFSWVKKFSNQRFLTETISGGQLLLQKVFHSKIITINL